MIKNKIYFSLVVGFSLLAVSAMPALAVGTVTSRQPRLEERQENREERALQRCTQVNSHIDARITHYNQNHEQVEARIARVNERMNELVTKLESKGYDVTKVKTAVQTLEAMRLTRRSDYSAFIEKLEETKRYDCGDSEGAFKSTLAESKTALATYRSQVKANWEFITKTLKPELQALKSQNPN